MTTHTLNGKAEQAERAALRSIRLHDCHRQAEDWPEAFGRARLIFAYEFDRAQAGDGDPEFWKGQHDALSLGETLYADLAEQARCDLVRALEEYQCVLGGIAEIVRQDFPHNNLSHFLDGNDPQGYLNW